MSYSVHDPRRVNSIRVERSLLNEQLILPPMVLDRKENLNGFLVEVQSDKGIIASLSNVNESERISQTTDSND
jgi:hypothetical protein